MNVSTEPIQRPTRKASQWVMIALGCVSSGLHACPLQRVALSVGRGRVPATLLTVACLRSYPGQASGRAKRERLPLRRARRLFPRCDSSCSLHAKPALFTVAGAPVVEALPEGSRSVINEGPRIDGHAPVVTAPGADNLCARGHAITGGAAGGGRGVHRAYGTPSNSGKSAAATLSGSLSPRSSTARSSLSWS